MYLPPHFQPPAPDALYDLIEANPLATLVTLQDGVPVADHLPLLLSREGGPRGVLAGHVARGNPLWSAHAPDQEVLAIFHGPQAYVSPGWYPSKADTGRVVPTWNYVSVQARGRLRCIAEPDWLLAHLAALTAQQERDQPRPWRLDDAPPDFIRGLAGSIMGLEITLSALEGKWKVSQNRPAGDIAPLAEQLERAGHADMAALVRALHPSAR